MAFRLKAPPIQVCLPSWLAGPIQVFMCHCWAFYRWFIQEVRLPTKVRISRDNNVQFAFWRLRKNPNAPRGYFWNSSNVQILRSPRARLLTKTQLREGRAVTHTDARDRPWFANTFYNHRSAARDCHPYLASVFSFWVNSHWSQLISCLCPVKLSMI